MFDGFKKTLLNVDGISINYIKGGIGPPLLLLHGYPQTHVIWHKVAPKLAKKFTVIASDLRGYGDSAKPPTTEDHAPYSKREMANDQVKLMKHLGYEEFYMIGHDRGGRVGHRMALDHPDSVKKLVVMDIAPTYTMYTTTDMEFAKAYYHWFFLIQPYDIPERMIGANTTYFMNKKFRQWGRDQKAFTDEAFNEYVRCFTPEAIHSSCEDYRASASIDLRHDEADMAIGKKINCPILCLWGNKGFVGNKYDVVAEWKKWGNEVSGFGLNCGHYLPEEAPKETLEALLNFLDS